MKILFKPFKKGFQQALGELENEIMQVLWDQKSGSATAKAIHDILSQKRKIAITTVFTVLDRLVEKGLLKKEKQNKTFIYQTIYSKDEYVKEVAKMTLQGLIEFSKDSTISCFVDVLSDLSKEDLERLKKLIDEKSKKI